MKQSQSIEEHWSGQLVVFLTNTADKSPIHHWPGKKSNVKNNFTDKV